MLLSNKSTFFPTITLIAILIGYFPCNLSNGPSVNTAVGSYANGVEYKCCDQSSNRACNCSDQTGGIGQCVCASTSVRKDWLCMKDNNGDSVGIFFKLT